MSAIYGAIDLRGRSISDDLIENFRKKYEEKGCKIDRYEQCVLSNAAFGCGIQYFTKEAAEEKLPFYDDERGILFTADCVLDNREQLINALGVEESDIPDGALLYKAYLRWGEDVHTHLRGMFAAVFYHKAENKVVLLNDHFATRCLFYHVRDGVLYFSTLLFPLVRVLGHEFELNERWLVDAVTVRGPAIMLEPYETAMLDVYKVASGTYVTVEKEQVEKHVFWNPKKSIKVDHKITLEESERLIREKMADSVQCAIRTDGLVSTQLSSGLDSSTVACLAAPMLAKQGKTLYSYTSVPHKDAEIKNQGRSLYNETEGVMKICKAYPNIEPTFVDTSDRNILLELEQLVELWELPCKSQQNAVWVDELLRQASARGCKIMLTGATGNCTLSAGSIESSFYYHFMHQHFRKAYHMFDAVKKVGVPRKRYIKALGRALKDYYRWYFTREGHSCYEETLTRPEVGERHQLNKRLLKRLKHNFPLCSFDDMRRQMFLLEANAQIGEIDTKCSLQYGILLRDPIRNVEVIELCHSLPIDCFSSSDYDRRLVREGMKGVVPEEIRHDVLHRGVQSGDNEYRLSHAWDQVVGDMESELRADYTKQFLSEELVKEYLARINKDNISENAMDARMLVDAYSFAKYLKKLKGIS